MIETTAVSRPRPPDMIPGYRLENLVGKGGMGEVHKATQLSLGRTVAVKLLASELAKDATFVTRFEKEAAALAQLSHPHIVSIVDKGKTKETYYLVMEYVDGPSLRELMRTPPTDVGFALRVALQICRAVEYAHGRGIIHRDLKPENILFDDQAGRIPKVSDFGLASFMAADQPTRFNVTETHVAMGTLSYMAPEQRVDAKSADHRADLYSLGVILYELLVGEVPVGHFDPPTQRRSGLDRRLDGIIARCLKPIPEDRYESAGALIRDLEPLVPQTWSQGPRKVSRVERARLAVRRVVVRAAKISAAVLVLAAAAVLSVAAYRIQNDAPFVANHAALGSVLEKTGALAAPGRISMDPEGRLVALGDGPDTLPLVGFGRKAELAGSAVRFGEVDDEGVLGRAELDVSELDGYQAQLVADVQAEVPSQKFFARLGRAITGKPPRPRAALMLEGLPGRYVALVLSGADGPVTLEWAMMERRGTMLAGQDEHDGRTRLELIIDREGTLRAFSGSGKDRRQVGEPLVLGAGWKRHFGKMPRPVLVCLEGQCGFDRIAFDVRKPPAAPVAVAVAPPAPAKTVSASSKTTSTVRKATTTTRKPATTRKPRR